MAARTLVPVWVTVVWLVELARADLPVHCPHHTIRGTWQFSLGAGNETKTLSCNRKPQQTRVCFYGSCYENRVLGAAKFKSVEKVTVVLSDPDDAMVTDGRGNIHRGTWTNVYDQGFQVDAMGKTFFAFSKFEGGKSICKQTWPGWHRDAGNPDKAAWGCYSAMKLSDSVEDLFEDDTTDSFQIAAKQLIEEMSDNQMDGTPYDLPREYQSALHLQLHHLRDYLAKTYEGDHDFVVRVNSAQQSWRAKVYAQFVGKPLRDLQLMSGYKPTRRAFDGLRPVRSSLLEIDEGTLPKTFDWRNKDGQNYVDPVVEQGNCGSCYAIATVSMLNSRVRIMTKNQIKTKLGWQQVLQCNRYSQSCAGGSPFLVEKYVQEFGLTKDNTCAKSHEEMRSLKELGELQQADSGNAYLRVKEFGYIGGYYGETSSAEIMKEVYNNGPVTVSLTGGYELLHYHAGVFVQTGEQSVRNDFTEVDHAVLLVGWGEERGGHNPYWILKNSFGTSWGEQGFFRVQRSEDADGILGLITAATPVLGGSNYFNDKDSNHQDDTTFLDVTDHNMDEADSKKAISSEWVELQKALYDSDELLSDEEVYLPDLLTSDLTPELR